MQRPTLLLPLALGALACCGSLAAQGFQPKPIRPLGCPQGERIVVEAGPVENPFVMNVTRTGAGNWLATMQAGFALGGVPGAINAFGRSGQVEDQTAEFKAAVTGALRNVDLQELLRAALERNLKSKTPCQTAYLKASLPQLAPTAPKDRVVGVGFFFGYQGGRPVLKARMGAMVLARNTSLEQVGTEAAALQKLSEELRTMPPRKMAGSGKVGEIQAASARLLNYMDGAESLTADSPAHPASEWLAGDGYFIRREIEAVMDRLAIQLGASLFP